MIKILDSSFTRLGAIKNTLSANRLEVINGENTLDYSATFDGRIAEFVDEDSVYELNDEYFDTAMITKSANDDGTVTVDVEAEHISYRLNDPLYNVDWFTEIGTPSYILGKILEGTGFTVGTIEFTESITYSAQEAKSRRQLLMEFVAYLGGEIGFNKFEVSIFVHRGSTEIVSVEKDRNIKIVSKTVNKRQKDEDGNDLVSYTCTPIFVPGDSYSLGDDIVLIKSSLKLNERLRVVNISYNPYDESQTTLEFANYTNGLESSLFRIETNTIAKNKLYYGARISPEMGFESIRSDLKARTVMNADTFAMQAGDGTGLWYNKLWFDPELGLYIFDGTLSADTIEAIKGEIDVVISNTTITNVISAQKGNIAELTVDQIDTSDKVPRYLLHVDNLLRKAPIGYWRGFDQYIEFVQATYIGDVDGVEQTEQATDRNGDPLYWLDADHIGTGVSTTVSSYPVMQFKYDELVKLRLFHEIDAETGAATPRMIWGAGNPAGRQKGFIYKDADDFAITYSKASDGTETGISIVDDGPQNKNGVGTKAIRNTIISPTQPSSAQFGDLWINPSAGDDLEALEFTSTGFTATYSGEEYTWTWTKDSEGKITKLSIDDHDIPVTWST